MTRKKHLNSICRGLLTVALALCAVFMIATPVKAEDAPIDWSEWAKYRAEYMTQAVAEQHARWPSSGLQEYPQFEYNKEDPVFGIIHKDGGFEPLTEGEDYTIEKISRTVDQVTTECKAFDKSIPGTYSFTLAGMGKYTGTVVVHFVLVDNDHYKLEKLTIMSNVDSKCRIKQGNKPKLYVDGQELVKGTDYKITDIWRNGIQVKKTTDFSKVGLYYMTIQGIGRYSGKSSVAFYIYKPVGKASLSGTTFAYNGQYIEPSVTVKDDKGNKIPSTQYTVKNPQAKAIGKHTVTIVFKNQYSYNEDQKLTYTIVPKRTYIRSLSRFSKGFEVTWAESTSVNASGYQIRYSTRSSMDISTSVKVKGCSSCNLEITGLKARKKYYVQVRTYKTVSGKTYYSDWSAKKYITTK